MGGVLLVSLLSVFAGETNDMVVLTPRLEPYALNTNVVHASFSLTTYEIDKSELKIPYKNFTNPYLNVNNTKYGNLHIIKSNRNMIFPSISSNKYFAMTTNADGTPDIDLSSYLDASAVTNIIFGMIKNGFTLDGVDYKLVTDFKDAENED